MNGLLAHILHDKVYAGYRKYHFDLLRYAFLVLRAHNWVQFAHRP